MGIILAAAALVGPTPARAECAGRIIATGVMEAPVCVPSNPGRLAVLDPWLTLGSLLDLGVAVQAVPLAGLQGTDLPDRLASQGVTDLGSPMEPSLERLVAVQPDLIIGSSYMHGRIRPMLARIAPTLLIDQMGWQDQLLLLAEATGRLPDARRALDDYAARAATIRARLPEGLTLSVLRVAPLGFQVYLDGPGAYGPYAVLADAGVRRTEYETATDGTMLKRPDWEGLSALTGDILFYTVVAGLDPAGDDRLAAETLANPLWQALPAVRTGRAYRVDRATWMGFDGLDAAHRVLDTVERHLLGGS